MGRPESMGDSPKAMASYWYAILRGDRVTPETRAAFGRWLAEAPGNRALYDSFGEVWDAARGMADHPQMLALRHQMAIQLTRRQSRWGQASFRIAVAAAVTAMAVGLAVFFDMPGWMAGKGRYATEIGERIEVSLPDQSQMTLNTRTRVSTAYTDRERRVILKEGQALFEVAREAGRPFVVQAGGRELRAVGTAFDVRIVGERVQVTMVEGTVKVPALPGGRDILIVAGDQLILGNRPPDAAPRAIGEAGVARAISWRDGRVIFEEAPLSEVVAEMNRYSAQKITLADPELGGLRLSGAFVTGKTQALVETVAVHYPIDVARRDRHEIVLEARR